MGILNLISLILQSVRALFRSALHILVMTMMFYFLLYCFSTVFEGLNYIKLFLCQEHMDFMVFLGWGLECRRFLMWKDLHQVCSCFIDPIFNLLNHAFSWFNRFWHAFLFYPYILFFILLMVGSNWLGFDFYHLGLVFFQNLAFDLDYLIFLRLFSWPFHISFDVSSYHVLF